MPTPEHGHPSFDIIIKENPAVRLRELMREANYSGGPSEFLIKALDVFEAALKPGAGGKIIVENSNAGKRYVFDIRHREQKKPLLQTLGAIVTRPFRIQKKT